MTQHLSMRSRSGWLILIGTILLFISVGRWWHDHAIGHTNAITPLPAQADPLLGHPAPHWVLADLLHPHHVLDSKQLIGHPYLFTVWASWCPACVTEQPVLQNIATLYRLRMIGYNWKDQSSDAKQWLAEEGNPFTDVVSDDDGTAALDWGVIAAPESFLVDSDGIVRWIHRGPLTSDRVISDLSAWLARQQAVERHAERRQ